MLHSSCIELSQAALRRNLRFLQRHVGPGVRFCSVIKGNAYGHSIRHFVPMAERCGVRQFAVFSADEALAALTARTVEDSAVLIMGAIDDEELGWAIENEVSFFVFDLCRLRAALSSALRIGRPARVHLELETGLNRTGLEQERLQQAAALILASPGALRLEGVCTHLAGAENVSNYLRISGQLETFTRLCRRLERSGLAPGLRHSACSAAALRYPESVMDMVRVGVAQYGFWPTKEVRKDYRLKHQEGSGRRAVDPLRRVMRWRSRVMSIKEVAPGEFVGYGTSYQTSRRQRLAVVPVGYFHGFARSLSNLGHLLVRGRRAPVAGTVNMNMVMIDVTDVPGVARGDEVVIIGRQRKAHLTVASFSDLTQFLNYEVLVRLPGEIPRVVVD